MKILFIIIGPISFKISQIIKNFIKQIEIQENKIYLMCDEINLVSINGKNINYINTSKNFNENIFKKVLNEIKFDIIFISNIETLLFDDSQLTIKRDFFKHINSTVLFLAPQLEVLFNSKSISYLNNSLNINFPYYILSPCPPNIPDEDIDDIKRDKNIEIIYWKNLESFAFLNKDDARENLSKLTRSSKDIKNVSIILDLEQVLYSSTLNFNYHYKIMIDCIYKYLTNLNIKCNLFLANISYPNFNNYNENVNLINLGVLNEEFSEMIFRSSDLILTEAIASPLLVEAANLKVPVINLKNTVRVTSKDEENTNLEFNFDELTEFTRSKIAELLENNFDCLFPYYSFPLKANNINFNETKIFGKYIFTMCDLFDEKEVTSTIKDLLLNEDAIKQEKYRIEQYLELRSDAIDATEIIEKLA
ncbi:MAG: hypothetical protein KatS3mg068_1039 [Candidatus Sericytochromatia bacterium]|nr:MAG: hypothetical protein KatS3mg068_1039 [Candidatus Sericytochromatia bacterium]